MNIKNIVTSVLILIAGIGVFLIGCSLTSQYLENLSGSKIKKIFAKTTNNKFLNICIGTVTTAAIQSSGATTVMVMGFISAGLITLTQALTLLFGACIGTSITGQIVAIGMSGGSTFSTTIIFCAFVGVGQLINIFSKKEIIKKISGILTGFGLLFVGLYLMEYSMKEISNLESIRIFISQIQNTILLIIIGIILTAILQSSSVTISICITMFMSGLISFSQGANIILGSFIGSSVVGLLAALTSKTNGKRIALLNLLFRLIGVVIFVLINFILDVSTKGIVSFNSLFNLLFNNAPQFKLAMFGTFSSIFVVLINLPFTNKLVKLSELIVKDKKEENKGYEFKCIDLKMLKYPTIATEQLRQEIRRMSSLSMTCLNLSLNVISTLNFEKEKEFNETLNEVLFLSEEMVKFVLILSKKELNDEDRNYLGTTFHTFNDLLRVAKYAENIIEYAHNLEKLKSRFSPDAVEEIKDMNQTINALYENAMSAYLTRDRQFLLKAETFEDRVDEITDEMDKHHISRLSEGLCTPEVGSEYLSLAQNLERIGDHLINVARTIDQIKK